MAGQACVPGDPIAPGEGYRAGPGAFDDGGTVRAAALGVPEADEGARTAGVGGTRKVPVPDAGDVVVGTVAAVMSTMFAVAIRFINGRPITSGVECICSTKNMRIRLVAMAGDVVALKILGRLNGGTHATIGEKQLGVLFTKCRKCGMRVITARGGVKCAECGWFDERKLSSEFGKEEALRMGAQP